MVKEMIQEGLKGKKDEMSTVLSPSIVIRQGLKGTKCMLVLI